MLILGNVIFQEINHAGSGGLWAELVSNRGLLYLFVYSFLFSVVDIFVNHRNLSILWRLKVGKSRILVE